MFTNSEGCTVWEKAVKDHTPMYIRHQTGAVYCETTYAQAQSGTNREPECRLFLCIPAPSVTYVPKPDDRLLPCICTDEKPPSTAYTVTTVKDFRYGSANVQHLEVTAK